MIRLALTLLLLLLCLPCRAEYSIYENRRLLKEHGPGVVMASEGRSVFSCRNTQSNIMPGKFCHWERRYGDGWTICVGPDGIGKATPPDEKLVYDGIKDGEAHLERYLFTDHYRGPLPDEEPQARGMPLFTHDASTPVPYWTWTLPRTVEIKD